MKNISIDSQSGHYRVFFNNQIQDVLSQLKDINTSHFLIDRNIWKLYFDHLSYLKDQASSVYLFNSIEKNKNLDSVSKYIKFLLKSKIDKKQKIVVIGGGLVQDIGSFTAHIIKRGIPWVFIPTTLLSMADSCIGGKSGINISDYKNQVGVFYPPTTIYISNQLLETLPKDQILNGIGEIIKHSIIKGGKSFLDVKRLLNQYRTTNTLNYNVIYKSLMIKKEIVEEDEFDTGRRSLLNYGHSFGHAIEGYSLNKIPHGIAVIIGMDIANYISWKRGYLSKSEYSKLSIFMRKYIPYKKIQIANINKYIDFLSKDKKVSFKQLSAILCAGVGNLKTVRIDLDEHLKHDIQDYCLNYYNQECASKS